MGSALTLGAIKKGVFESHQVLAYDPVPEAIAALGDGISAAGSLEEAIQESDILLLCVKPYQVSEILAKIPTLVESPEKLLVISIAAGVKIETMERSCNHEARIVRTMPNTPALVGEGAAAFTLGKNATDADADGEAPDTEAPDSERLPLVGAGEAPRAKARAPCDATRGDVVRRVRHLGWHGWVPQATFY